MNDIFILGISGTDEVMIINDDISPNAVMPTGNEEESNELLMMSSNITVTPRFSDDEEDDDEYENQLSSHQISDHDYDDDDDDDDDILIINNEIKASPDIYNTNILRTNFPFDRFRSFINDHVHQLVLSYSTPTNRTKPSLTQIYKSIVLSLNDKRPLIFQIQANDPAGPISSYAMIKFEKTNEKFQSRLLTLFDEQTIVHGLLCLWLLRDSFQNRLLPSMRISHENNFRDISPQKFKRSIKQSSIYVLFRLIKDDGRYRNVYIKLLQAMYFFQPELAYILLYYLSVDVENMKIAEEIFEKFSKDIIKLSSNHRK
jgi:hypothetical protein